MGLLDLISGLSYVAGHIGLARLDRGLRDSIEIPTDQLQAHVTLLARNAQIVTLTNQVQQLRGQANKAQKQRLNAQHAQLMVQVGQLQLQLQQLNTDRQRLQLEEKRELRLAQENRIMRLFVDVFEQAQTYRLQGQSLDFVVVTLAAFRLYRQVYNDLDDAQNRLRLSDLRERLFVSVNEILTDDHRRQQLAHDYAAAVRKPLDVVNRAQRAQTSAHMLLSGAQASEAASSSWRDAFNQAGAGIENLQGTHQTLNAARQDLAALVGGGEWREFFFPVQPDKTGGMLTAVAGHWQSWVAAINALAGQPLGEVYRALDQLPGQLEQTLKQVDAAVGQSQVRQLNYQLAEALAALGEALPPYRTRYLQLDQQFAPLKQVAKGASGPALLDGVFELQQIQANLLSWFGPLRGYLEANKHGGEPRYQAEAAERMAKLGSGAKQVSAKCLPDAFAAYRDVQALNAAISRSIAAHLSQLQRSVVTDDGFQLVRTRAEALSNSAQIAEVDQLATQAAAKFMNRIGAALQTQRQKQASQHWQWVEHFLRLHPPSPDGPTSSLPPVDELPPMPPLTGKVAGKPIPPLTAASVTSRGSTSRRILSLVGTILAACVCLCLVLPLLVPEPTVAAQATRTARAQATVLAVAHLTELARPTDTAEPTPTSTPTASATSTTRPTNTPSPTATRTASPTSTLDPSITPPTATPTSTETLTPTPTATPTATQTPSPTSTPTATSTSTQTRTPTPAPVGMLPGLNPDELIVDVEDLGFDCDPPEFFGGVYSWWCTREQTDKNFYVEVWSRTLDTVDAVRGTVLHLDLVPNDALSLELLGYVATLPYTGAQPEQARAWVARTMPTITQNGDIRSTRFGGVSYELYGWPNARNLIIGTFVEP